ncbi:MAG: hypothetical protein RLZZ450_1727 [Pseudomonadota bacterium]
MSLVRSRARFQLLVALSASTVLPSLVLAQAAAPAPTAAPVSTPAPTVAPAAAPTPSAEPGAGDPVTTGGLTPPGAFASPDQAGVAIAPAPAVEPPPPEQVLPDPTLEGAPVSSFELQTVQDDLNGLRTDVENFKFQWQRERDIHTAITTRFLTLGGNIQARFNWVDEPVYTPNKAAPTSVYKRQSSFDIPTAQITAQGSLYRDYEEGRNLTYNVSFGVSQQANNNSFLNLQNAQVIYSFMPTANGPEAPLLTLTVGQQLLPFGLEAQAAEDLRPVIRNAQFTTAGTSLAGGLHMTRRDLGLIVRGDLFPMVDFGYNYRVPVLAYAIGVMNGAGANQLDDNNKKDLIARLAFTVPTEFNSWLRQFTLGGTAYWGKQNVALKDMAKTLIGTGKRERYGADIYYNHWPFGITYEFVRGKDEYANGVKKEAAQRYVRQSDSHTGTFFLSWGEQFVASFRQQGRFDDWWPKTYQPFFRYDRFNSDTNKRRDLTTTYTLGFNLFFAETTKFQFNYNLKWDTSNAKDVGTGATAVKGVGWTNEALAQVQFGF